MIDKIKDIALYLIIGTLGMIVLGLMRSKKYEISKLKAIVSMLLLTVFGVLGVLIMYYIENGSWGGLSYFGAVLITPILLYPIALLLKVPYLKFLGYCAPAECFMLAVMKFNCLQAGCCFGLTIIPLFDIIPLQLIEAVAGLIIMMTLVLVEKKDNLSEGFARYLVLYGVVRFILNFYRSMQEYFILNMTPGHFWSLVSIVIGISWLVISVKLKKKKV